MTACQGSDEVAKLVVIAWYQPSVRGIDMHYTHNLPYSKFHTPFQILSSGYADSSHYNLKPDERIDVSYADLQATITQADNTSSSSLHCCLTFRTRTAACILSASNRISTCTPKPHDDNSHSIQDTATTSVA